ncbi:MAG: MutT/nudix family protein [Parcubacteria group bacterium Athens0714_25]|uniref:MutT/nudix family protein n=1 Tax=Candidatus Berkelbacteria bacterium Athens1014_28 TaxID=2017145 RepID=A0A554LLC8_9BACT|nr:MAG: MutT/nudix family protein [Candidatus Berkelbacteria bacterium Athens1014_28]TSD02136.1 MAG: MutT/nudix family protein [Parcubacteria group bacterium Athens0714_25]
MKKIKPGHDYIGVGGGVFIFNKKKEVLLMKRAGEVRNESGWWSKPGGKVSYGEKTMNAMKREIKEELGVEIDIWGLLPHTDHIIKKENQHWVAINYLADIKSGEPKIMEPHKCEEIGWFKINKLPSKTTQTTKEPARYFLEKKYIKLK